MYQDLYLSKRIKNAAFILAGIFALGSCILFWISYNSSTDAFTFTFFVMAIFLVRIAFRHWKTGRYDAPYLTLRPDGIHVHDLPMTDGGFISWNNIYNIETFSFPRFMNTATIRFLLEYPDKFRARQSFGEQVINLILKTLTLGMYSGPYFYKHAAIFPVKEMTDSDLATIVSKNTGITPFERNVKFNSGHSKIVKFNRWAFLVSICVAIFIVAYNAIVPHLPDSAATSYTLDLKILAEQGNPDAQTKLGWRYSNGYEATKNHKIAVYWWRKAAKQGFTKAEYNLGLSYGNSRGVKRDYHQAFRWMSKAAAKEFTLAEYTLGWMYERGKGVEKDIDLALEYYQRAALKKHEYSIKAVKRLKG